MAEKYFGLDTTTGKKDLYTPSGGGDMTKAVYDSDANGILEPAQLNLSGKADTTHAHAPSDVTGTAVITTDSRLSDNRTPIDGSATNAKLANMATKTYKGRTAGTTGVPEDVAVATVKSDLALVKGDVGLGNVDNTTDLGKPISTLTQTALDNKLDDTQFSGLAKITVGITQPSSPSVGDLWIDTN